MLGRRGAVFHREIGAVVSPATFLAFERAAGNQQRDLKEIARLAVVAREGGRAGKGKRLETLYGVTEIFAVAHDPGFLPHLAADHIGDAVELGGSELSPR